VRGGGRGTRCASSPMTTGGDSRSVCQEAAWSAEKEGNRGRTDRRSAPVGAERRAQPTSPRQREGVEQRRLVALDAQREDGLLPRRSGELEAVELRPVPAAGHRRRSASPAGRRAARRRGSA